MSKFELSLSRDYVPDWTIVDAVRELFQNALDQQTTVEGNEMFFEYSKSTQQLKIGNKLSVLSPNSLLLGASSKRGDDKTIGQFGEGYKIATLVLTRLGKKVTFYNYGAREVWDARFVKSRRYQTDVLTIFVNKKYPWSFVPDNNLTITIDGVTVEEYESIKLSNLHLTKPVEYFSTDYGRILLDSQFKGAVFVNGLFVTSYSPYHYGYDFKPGELKLDRDRKLVSDFNLQYLASKMWRQNAGEGMAEIAADLVAKNAADVQHVIYDWYVTEKEANVPIIADTAHKRFVQENGVNAVPVTSNHEMTGLSPKYKPVIVAEVHKKAIIKSANYKEPEKVVEPTFHEKVTAWLDEWQGKMHPGAAQQLRDILKEENQDGESEEVLF